MLFQVEIKNFYSIRELQVIDLRLAGNAPADPTRWGEAWAGSDIRVPKVVALFGANASGKSNVLKALSFISWFAKDSFSAPRGTRMPFDRFNDLEMLKQPTRLAIQIAGLEDVSQAGRADAKQCRYAYEFTLGGDTPVVLHEALHYWPSTSRKRVRLFERQASGEVLAGPAFGLTGYRQALEKVLRPDASVVATLTQLDHPFAKLLWNAANQLITNILLERRDTPDDQLVRHYAANPKLVEVFNSEIERIDVGIQAMEVHNGANGPFAVFRHDGLAAPMPWIYESQGTRQFIRLYPILLHALETGGIAVLDELDAAIHPLLLPEILRWFYDPDRNPHDAQLWMSCHNASLLEELTKEEVLFCDKDRSGRTSVYSLRDIQSVRRADNYCRKYLGGVYGAIPQIG
jgi:hypothetical protein